MEIFSDFLSHINDPSQRVRTNEVLEWVHNEFTNLEPRVSWNQPMFTDHGTFIIGFSISKQHLAVSPEGETMIRFSNEIAASGYTYGTMLFRIKWDTPVDYELLKQIIDFNCADKAECKTFWRK